MPLTAEPALVLQAFKNLTDKSPTSLKAFLAQYFKPAGSELEVWQRGGEERRTGGRVRGEKEGIAEPVFFLKVGGWNACIPSTENIVK
jgi:hypothetical protein